MTPTAIPDFLSIPAIILYLGAGLAVGVGIMIIGLAKWGKKISIEHFS